MVLDIILFAALAVFLIFRLNSVLGKKTGHENPYVGDILGHPEKLEEIQKEQLSELIEGSIRMDEGASLNGILKRIELAYPEFDEKAFISGCKAAFEQIVKAYQKRDLASCAFLMTPEIQERFQSAQQQDEDGQHFTLDELSSADIIGADIRRDECHVTVKFISDQIFHEKSSDKHMTLTDIWTFSRPRTSKDPNWTLVDIESVE